MVHAVIRAIGRICDAVSVHVKRGEVGPVVARPVLRPFDPFGRHVFHLRAVADEAVANDPVVIGPGSEVNANPATLKPVAREVIFIRVVEERAFLGRVLHIVSGDHAAVGIVQHDPMIAVIDRDIVRDLHAGREHDRISKVIADRNIARHLGIVGVHVVHGEAQIAERVVAENVPFRRIDKDTVTAPADLGPFDNRPRRVPNLDAVAARIHVAVLTALDPVVRYHSVVGAMNINPIEIAQKHIVANDWGIRSFQKLNT